MYVLCRNMGIQSKVQLWPLIKNVFYFLHIVYQNFQLSTKSIESCSVKIWLIFVGSVDNFAKREKNIKFHFWLEVKVVLKIKNDF